MSITTTFSRVALCALLAGGGAVACGGDDDGGSSSAFCDTVKEIDDFEFDFEAEDAEAQATEFQKLLDQLQEQAPDEIKDDMETVFSAEEAGDTESDEYKEAEERLNEYVKDECGITLDE